MRKQAGFFIFFFFLFSAGLSFGSASAQARSFTWVRSADALTLDPYAQNEGTTTTLLHQIYETLVDRDEEGQLVGKLAVSWQLLPDNPRIWEFKLRPNVMFHGGQQFTADDVVYSLQRARAPESEIKTLHTIVEDVIAVDALTVQIKTKAPSPTYVNNLTSTFILSKNWAEGRKLGQQEANGTGAYTLKERVPNQKTILVSFKKHWSQNNPQADEVIYLPLKLAKQRIDFLLNGKADLVQDLSAQDVEQLQKTKGIKLASGLENRTIFFAVDLGSSSLRTASIKSRNPFSDIRVRRAMNFVLDRGSIQKNIMRGYAEPTGTIIPTVVNGWSQQDHIPPKPDLATARSLMAEAGYADGFSVSLHCPNDRYMNDEAICHAYANMLSALKIKATIVSQSRAALIPLIEKADVDFYLMGWGVPTYDAAYIFDYLVHSRQVSDQEMPALGVYNGSHYANPKLDQMIVGLATEIDLLKRNALISEITKTMQNEQIFLPVHNQMLIYAMKENVVMKTHPENHPRMADVTFLP